jgi:heterodisulfide reductase subunit A-like polyferredoxin
MSAQPATGDLKGAVLVVGGGIAGIQASLDLAEQGFHVNLVESKSAIGGHMAQLDKTFPTNDCAMCTISPKLVETGRHLNIDLIVDAEVMDIEGEAGNFTVRIRQKPRYIDLEKCVGCGECTEVCPVELPDPFNEGLSTQKAIFKLYPQAVPNAYSIAKLGTAPCRNACPAEQRAQGYIALIAQGRYREALRVIKEDNPFPSVCGRTCHHPCEGHCSRALVDEPVNIMGLKRFVVDYALAYGRERVEPVARTRPEWIAVVGAGPAGLTAAHDLALLGYGVTVYEALPVAGGMMRVGIPAHRLPKGVLQQDIDDILALGINLKTGSPVRDPAALLQEGYDAVCMATGISTRDHSLGVNGEEAEGVVSAATFLRRINLGEPMAIGDRVAVVGGGITALDAAAVARRLGAQEVYLALDRPRGELPAYHWEMAAIEAEGIQLLEHTALVRILAVDGKVTGVELAKTGKGMVVDEEGRRRPRLEEGSEFELPVDTVIGTVGQQSDLSFLHPQFDELSSDAESLMSEIEGLFVVGGRKTGASYIVEAIALGHRVAKSIHSFLQKSSRPMQTTDAIPVVKFTREQVADMIAAHPTSAVPRNEPAMLPLEERVTSFREVVLGMTEHQARAEAGRCLQCGICSECLACVYACGTDAINHEMTESIKELQVGAIVLAPGYEAYEAELAQEYGLGRYSNVITALQLERMLSASGPTAGHVLRPSDHKPAQKIAFLQCVGSRDQSHDYCSAVCCMYATKESILLKEHDPQAEVHVYMMDIRAFSKGYESYYQRARDQYGIEYTRCRISSLQEQPGTEKLILRYRPSSAEAQPDAISASRGVIEEEFDMVVLSVGMQIAEPVRQLGRTLEIELDDYGFCHTATFDPVETSRAGIYAVGPFREPKDIPESIIDASAAAGRVGALLAPARGTLARKAIYPPERDIQNEPVRVGVFVCHCGSNIAGVIDVPAVTAYAAQLPSVVYADHMLYTCSQDSTAAIQACIQEHQLNRVVVASCTPITHGPLFQEVLREAGLNQHLLAMANIRNQCSWVHSDQPQVATEKAKDLVRMAVGRVNKLQPLQSTPAEVHQTALVIGGGPAGMNAALTIAEQGYPVHLVEREAQLGGNLRRMYFGLQDETGAPGEAPQAYLERLITRIDSNELIETHLSSTLVRSEGFVGNFQSTLTDASGELREIEHGVTIVATGGQEYRGDDYGYGQHPRVVGLAAFEQFIAAAQGRAKPSTETGFPPGEINNVVMIQCIGPAERYCARTCCTLALKNALEFKRLRPQSQITILHRDLRVYGFKERLYRQAREAGVFFVRYEPESPPEVDLSDPLGPIGVRILDPTLEIALGITADLLVLSMPMVPSEGNRTLGTALKVPVDMDGWFLEAHVKLRPVDFASDGIFLAGSAHYPKLLDEAIVQAQAAASRAVTLLSKPTISRGGAIAHVNAEACVGCLTCVRICPFGVPRVSDETLGVGGVKGAVYIEPAICQGCGTCVGECPAYAIELLHYRHDQMESEVSSLLAVGAMKSDK